MVHIPAGSFLMGSPETEKGRKGRWDYETQHKVTLMQDYYMGAYPVTQELWESIIGSNPITNSFVNLWHKLPGLKKPVVYVSWNDATEFCKKLTKIEQKKGNISLDWEYCLPTEMQWEYACRAGSQERYYNAYTKLDDIAWYENNSNDELHEVGQKKPNAFGLYDMLGNVNEWCSTWHCSYSSNPVTNPIGPTIWLECIACGGGWFSTPVDCCCDCRDYCASNSLSYDIGFRLALCKV